MKTIGLLGGMSWESTTSYYKAINTEVNRILGGLHSAKIVLISVNFEPIAQLQVAGQWNQAAELLSQNAQQLESAGADILLICTNTMHKVADEVVQEIRIPLLHIADCTAKQIQVSKLNKVALLGTQFTMEQPFYQQRLKQAYAQAADETCSLELDILIPTPQQRQLVHQIIFEELCHGIINPESKSALIKIINQLQQQGAQGIILGCTELALLINAHSVDIEVFDTTLIHAKAAVEFALTASD